MAQVNALMGKCDIGATYITDDGKTRIIYSIFRSVLRDCASYFSQTVANGVTIDWGDGSDTETKCGTGNKSTSHTYTAEGDYVVTTYPQFGCDLGLGVGRRLSCYWGNFGTVSRLSS